MLMSIQKLDKCAIICYNIFDAREQMKIAPLFFISNEWREITMEKNGMTTNSTESEHFKKIDRVDRGKTSSDGSDSDTRHDGAPNPNSESHKPKIVPWK